MLRLQLTKLSDTSVKNLQQNLGKTYRRYCSKAEKAAEPIPGIAYDKLTVGVPRELFKNEKRIALSPAATALLTKKGFNVAVEENAGLEAKFMNEEYAASGARSEEHTSELQSPDHLVCRLLLEKKKPNPPPPLISF